MNSGWMNYSFASTRCPGILGQSLMYLLLKAMIFIPSNPARQLLRKKER